MALDFPVTRLGDNGTGHGCWPPRGNDQASPNVFTNNIAVHRVTDHWPIHCCGPACHDSNLAEGSRNVFVNNLAIGRISDAVACGSKVAEGSPDVYAGGESGKFITSRVFVEPTFIAANPYTLEAAGPLIFGAGVNAPHDDPDSPVIDYGVTETLPETRAAPSDDPTLLLPEPAVIDTGLPTVCGSFITSPEIDYDQKLSTNYTIANLSIGAVFKHSIQGQNDLTVDEIICNLQAVAENILEPLAATWPGVRVNSGFRKNPPGKDSVSSQHNKGMAIDVQWPGISVYQYNERAAWIRDNLPFDQFIFEHGKSIWLHVSYNRTAAKQRGQQLTFYPPGTPDYKPGLVNYYAFDEFGGPTKV